MIADKIMLLKMDPMVKSYLEAAAAREGISANKFAQKTFVYYLTHLFPRQKIEWQESAACLHCAGRIGHRDNHSGYCRKCQRTYGLPTLRRMHPSGKQAAR